MSAAVHANVSEVLASLWIGGDLENRNATLAGAQVAELVELGITDIINCRIEWSDEGFVAASSPQIGYCWLGVDDAGQRMSDEWFDAGTTYILDCIAAGGTVLAHCHMGINRGPSMGFAAMLALGWDPIAALERIRGRRPIAYVSYAEDAIDWWLRRQGASEVERLAVAHEVARWRRENRMDVAQVIRQVRLGAGA